VIGWWFSPISSTNKTDHHDITEFLKFVGPIGPRGQKIMRSANNVGNAGPHVSQTFLNDVFTFLTEVGFIHLFDSGMLLIIDLSKEKGGVVNFTVK
jgi:hypothetical protein